jgi:hypothetical protein
MSVCLEPMRRKVWRWSARGVLPLCVGLGLLLLPSQAWAGSCVSGAPKNPCGPCRAEAQCGGSAKTRLCMRNKTKRCKNKSRSKASASDRGEPTTQSPKAKGKAAGKAKRKAAGKAKRKAARKAKRKAARKAARKAKRRSARKAKSRSTTALAGFRVDLLKVHAGEEVVYIQNSGLLVTDTEGNTIASVPFRGEAGGGDALRIKSFAYHDKDTPAVISVWNWCTETESGAIKCLNYEDTCWESKGGLECTGPPK